MSEIANEMSRHPRIRSDRRFALLVAGLYCLVAASYILFSDWAVSLVTTDMAFHTLLQNWKGIGFVIVTATLLYFVLKGQFQKVRMNGHLAFSAAQRLKAIGDVLPNPLAILDTKGRLAHWNRLAREISGFSDEALQYRSVTDLVCPEDQGAVETAISQIVNDGISITLDARLVSADGDLIPHRWHGSPLHDAEGHLNGIVVLGVELTDLKEAEYKLRQSLADTRNVLHQAVETISLSLEKRDPYTAGHQRRVAALAVVIAEEVGLGTDECEGLRYAALLHDIGKLAVPTDILTKPGRLNEYEFGLVKLHAEHGYEIVRKIDFRWPVADMIRQHHERLDGSGYPQGLAGEAIISGARILAVADVVEAMAGHRPYRPELGIDAALKEVRSGAGKLYDAEIAAACERVFEAGFTFPGTDAN